MSRSNSTMAAARAGAEKRRFDVDEVRRDFPILNELVRAEQPLVYLDNAATSQKPQAMIDAISDYYLHANSNVHRGVHALSERATLLYEGTREKVQRFVNARESREIIFVRGTTEAVNLVAHGYGSKHVQQGDEVVVTGLEHHSNFVPWQLLCERVGAKFRVVPMLDSGELDREAFSRTLSERTRMVAIGHVSNALGTINPIQELIAEAHALGVPVLVDGAQAAPHLPIDVQELDCDFYTVSGHKMYAPMGIGVLYGKAKHLEDMDPYQSGGDMIRTVAVDETTLNTIPWKFEAGTPHVEGVVGLGATIDYLSQFAWDEVERYEDDLLSYATEAIGAIDGVRILGTGPEKTSIVSFCLDGVHPHDVGTILDTQGIAIRAGHHCAQPIMNFYGVDATVRVSVGIYNTKSEIDAVVTALEHVRSVFG